MSNEISNEVQANRELRAVHDRLMDANAKLAKWHMTFETSVRPGIGSDMFEVHVQARVGEKVFTRIVRPEEIEYFMGDKFTITDMLARTFLIELLGDVACEELGIVLTPAMDNAEKINARRRKT